MQQASTLGNSRRPSCGGPRFMSATASSSGSRSTSAPTVAFPRIGVSAVIFRHNPASSQANDEVLLVQRAKSPNQGYWSLPGGKLRLGETIEQATVREIMEETGLEVKIQEPFYASDAIFYKSKPEIQNAAISHGSVPSANDVEFHYVIIQSVGYVLDSRMMPKHSSDAMDAQWISLNKLKHHKPDIIQLTHGLVAVIQKAFDHVKRKELS